MTCIDKIYFHGHCGVSHVCVVIRVIILPTPWWLSATFACWHGTAVHVQPKGCSDGNTILAPQSRYSALRSRYCVPTATRPQADPRGRSSFPFTPKLMTCAITGGPI